MGARWHRSAHQRQQTCRAAFGLETKTITAKNNMESMRSCAVHLHDSETLSKAVQLMFLETWGLLKCAHMPWHETWEFCFCMILRGLPHSKPLHLLWLWPFQFLSVQDSIWKRLRKGTERQTGLIKKQTNKKLRARPHVQALWQESC